MRDVYIDAPQRQYFQRPKDQWYQELDQLHAAVSARRNLSRVSDVDLKDLIVMQREYVAPGAVAAGTKNAIMFEAPKMPFALMPTNYAFGQLCSLAKSPAQFLRELPLELLQPVLQHRLAKRGVEDAFEGRLLAWPVPVPGGEEDTDVYELRAATSASYGRIWDIEVVELAQRIIDATGGKFTNPKVWGGKKGGLYASDRDVFMFFTDGGSIVDGGGERDQLHRGFYLWNSEVGAATFGLATFLFRMVCGNHGIWGAEQLTELRIRHTLGAPDRFVAEAAPALKAHINAPAAPLEAKIKKAKAFEIEGAPDVEKLVAFGKKHSFTAPEIKGAIAYANREEASEVVNLWTLHNGLTAYARDFAWIDARVDLERRAGKLLALAA